MPRQQGTQVVNTLQRGLITEASALSFPENAFTESDNIRINLDNVIDRRKGIDLEDSYSTVTETRSSDAISTYVWENVGGDGDLIFVVTQIGAIIRFYEVTADGVLSDNRKSFTIDLGSYDLTIPDASECQYADGGGRLFVFHPNCSSFYVDYNAAGDSITVTSFNWFIRDFDGVDDSLETTERPTSLTDAHEYNLYNQGWWHPAIDDGGTRRDNAIDAYKNASPAPSDWPANSDVWWYAKNANDYLDAAYVHTQDFGNSPAPKGHFILNAFDTDRSGAHADIGTVTEKDSNNLRPSTGTFFAGRHWGSGVNYEDYTSKVYFSQIIEGTDNIGKCYQSNDPTSEINFDLLPSDGGVVDIQEAGSILKLIPYKDSILVMASNGVWSISGSEGVGFRANDFSIVQLSGSGIQNQSAVVLVEGVPYWWNLDGIWTIDQEQGVVSLTKQTIQETYNSIPPLSKKYAKGAYNKITEEIQWVYTSSSPGSVEARYNYNKILCYNVRTGAFFIFSVSNDSGTSDPSINGIVSIKNPLAASVEDNAFYYLASYLSTGSSYPTTFAREYDTAYKDWTDVPNGGSGTDYSSYLITGYTIAGEANKNFQNNFVDVYLNNDATGETEYSLFIQGLWEFTTTNTNRFSTAQQLFQYNDGHNVTSKRVKIRGNGKSLQLKFYSETGKPFELIGWSAWITGNTLP